MVGLKGKKSSKSQTTSSKSVDSKQESLQDDFEEFLSSEEEIDEEEEEEEEEDSDDSFNGFASSDSESEKNKEKTTQKVDESKIKQKIKDVQIQRKKSGNASEKPGVVYIGRIPHGFYEDQMKNYFSQFGTINRLRLSRNKKTGKSKHYGFVEFESNEVARIVADTMDNYLLFGHILKVKLMPSQNVHEDLFNGANRTFKSVPWRKIAKQRNDRPKSLDTLKKLQAKETKRRSSKEQKLKELGIDYSISEPPVLKANVTNGEKVQKSKKKAKKSFK